MAIAESELHFSNSFELLVAVILSAQCTDKRINMVTPDLFARFPDAKKMSESDSDEIFEYIKSVSYPRNKANNLHKMSCQLVEEFDMVIPEDIEKLQLLAGVGRKTANVVASVWFDKPAMAVDTHVFRVSDRIGLTYRAKNPRECEDQLVANIPTEYIATAHHWLILHGRYVCKARRPECEVCGITSWCKYYSRNNKNSSKTLNN